VKNASQQNQEKGEERVGKKRGREGEGHRIVAVELSHQITELSGATFKESHRERPNVVAANGEGGVEKKRGAFEVIIFQKKAIREFPNFYKGKKAERYSQEKGGVGEGMKGRPKISVRLLITSYYAGPS